MLNESKASRSILSEGLKHHIDANKPLTENLYRAGSRDYFDLIAEARSLYSRGILEFTNKRDIELLTETDQGHFGVYEGKKVPLDFPMLNEDERSEDKKIDILNQILSTLQNSEKDGEDREEDLENLDISIDQMTAAMTGKNAVAIDFDQDVYGRFASVPKGDTKKLKEDIVDYDFSKEELIRVIKQLKRGASTEIGMIKAFEKALGRELTDDEIRGFKLDEAKFKGKTVDLNKPTRGDSKKFKVYVNSGKKNADGSIKVKKVNFGHGGTTAKKAGQKTMKIRKSNPKARKAFRARHKCDNPGPKTMARYWSCKKW